MAEPQESGCEDQPIESSWGWSLLPCISGGGLDAAWFEEQQQKKKAVTPCTNQVPKDPNRLAVAEVLLGESLGPGYFGQRLYSKDQHGQRNAIGAPNGAYVDREQVEYGMVLMYSALLNRADQDRKTVGREVLDNAGQYDGFSRGVEKLTDPDFATNNPVGGYLSYCDELGWLLDAMDGVDNGGRNPYVLAWVAVVQGNSVRDFYNGSKKGPYDRVGGNDFFTIRF